jgi:2-dehydro-3-deoxyphosphogluconate aldolase/(4S)-4-hydroxy-2-oxoglutarate aldolase
MPTGGVETTKESITAWFKAGITAAGIGSNLIKKDLIATENYEAITAKTAEVLAWIQELRRDLKK